MSGSLHKKDNQEYSEQTSLEVPIEPTARSIYRNSSYPSVNSSTEDFPIIPNNSPNVNEAIRVNVSQLFSRSNS